MYDMLICDDCTIAAANDDYSGMDAATEAAVREGMSKVGGWLVVGDHYADFSKHPCDCCGTHLHGGRHTAVVLSL